jgi:hypothetical protein
MSTRVQLEWEDRRRCATTVCIASLPIVTRVEQLFVAVVRARSIELSVARETGCCARVQIV